LRLCRLDNKTGRDFAHKDAFYSKLKGEWTTDEHYKHAKKVWKEFKMKTF